MPTYIPEVQLGAVAYVFGITNSGSPISMTGTASLSNFELESADLSSTWNEKENTDSTGNVQNITQSNFKYETTFKFFPTGSTRALALTGADAIVNAYKITTANFAQTEFNGTWRVKPGTKINLKMDDNASIDISCERYTNAPQNTNLTTILS